MGNRPLFIPVTVRADSAEFDAQNLFFWKITYVQVAQILRVDSHSILFAQWQTRKEYLRGQGQVLMDFLEQCPAPPVRHGVLVFLDGTRLPVCETQESIIRQIHGEEG